MVTFKFRKWLVRGLVFFTTCVLLLGVCEGVLRSTHLFGAKRSWSEPDPELGYRFTPNKAYWHFQENDHPITGTINSHGWRDKERSLEKPANTYRIAVLGDSYVEAFQVELERTSLALAEAELNSRPGMACELLNFGRSGFTQSEELLLLEQEVLEYSPDAVMLFFLPSNDIQDVRPETAPTKLRPFYQLSSENQLILDTRFSESREFEFKSWISAFKQGSALVSLFCEKYNAFKKMRQWKKRQAAQQAGTRPETPRRLPGALSLCTEHPDPEYLTNYHLNKTLIKEMARICQERGIRFLLVSLNLDAYLTEKTAQYRTIDPTFEPSFFADDLEAFARSIAIEHLGLQKVFSEHYRDTGHLLHWGTRESQGHWNYRGHARVAETLVSRLQDTLPQ